MLHTRMNLLSSLVFVLLCFGSVTAVRADIITLNAVDSGQYFNDGFHDAAQEGYAAGSTFFFASRNFFVFDLSGVMPGTITSATLRLFNPPLGFFNPQQVPNVTFTLFDIVAPISILRTSQPGFTVEGRRIFSDLGSGSVYGSRVVSAADNNTFISFSLNTPALSDLNNAGLLFAIGGRIVPDTLGIEGGGPERAIFLPTTGAPAPGTRQLVLEATPIPEPATMILLSTGLVGVAVQVRRQRAAKRREATTRSNSEPPSSVAELASGSF